MSKLFTNGTLNRGGNLSKEPGVNYKSDGTGRDTYILNNNGGLKTTYQKPLLGGSSSYNMLPQLNYGQQTRKSPSPFQAKNVNYRADGSGRDFYIAYVTSYLSCYRTDNGGQSNSSNIKDYKAAFTSSLRTYEPNGDYLKSRKPPTNYELIQKNKQFAQSYIKQMTNVNSRNEMYQTLQKPQESGSPIGGTISGLSMNYGRHQASTSPLRPEDYVDNRNNSYSKILRKDSFNKTFTPQDYNRKQSKTNNGLVDINDQQGERNSFNVQKYVSDNRTQSQIRQIESYQRNLDSKLSQPKQQSPTRSQYLTVDPQQFEGNKKSPNAMDHSVSYSTMSDGKKSSVKLRKINLQEREEIFKEYFERQKNRKKNESTMSKSSWGLSQTVKQQSPTKQDDTYSISVNGVYDKFDTNKNNQLSFDELRPFYNEMIAHKPELTNGGYKNWFNSIDVDRDGNISQSELKAYLSAINYIEKRNGGRDNISVKSNASKKPFNMPKAPTSMMVNGSVNSVYEKFDLNKDSLLSPVELKPFYKELIQQRPDLRLTENQFQAWFQSIDKNRNGNMEPAELNAYLISINYKSSKSSKYPNLSASAKSMPSYNPAVNAIYERFDINKDLNLSPDELRPFYNELVQQRPDLLLKNQTYNNWFNSIDKDQNGNMDPDELQAYLTSINYKLKKGIYQKLDVNKDNSLSAAELRPFFNQLLINRPDLKLSENQFQYWFNSIDKDRDGVVEQSEFQAYLTSIRYNSYLSGKSPTKSITGSLNTVLNGIYDRFDVNKDNLLSAVELRPFFRNLLVQRPDLRLTEGKFEAWFNAIDKDRDGIVDQKELQAYLALIKFKSHQYKSTFNRFDINKDKELSPTELRPFFDELVAQRPDLQLGKIRYETWFNSIDSDKNGNMDPKELQIYLASIDYQEPRGNNKSISHTQSSLLTKAKQSDVLTSIYARFDKNRDKMLTAVELRPFFNELMIQRRDLCLSKFNYDGWFNQIDKDRDGKLDQSELQTYLDSINYAEKAPRALSRTITMNGPLDKPSFGQKKSKNPIVNSIYDRFDINKDQELSPDELKPFFNELAKERPDLSLNSQKYLQWFNSIDLDRDGNMDPQELEAYLKSINYKMIAKVSKAAAKIYDRFDVNNDRNLSKTEIKPFYMELISQRPDLRLTENGFEQWFNSIDSDKNGDMDHSELEAYLQSINYKNVSKQSKTVAKIYDQFDANKDKNLTIAEIRPFYIELIAQRPDLRLSENNLQVWFNSIDLNRNGNLDPRELQSYLSSINYKFSKMSQKVSNLFQKFDINKDKLLSMAELRPFFIDLIGQRPDLRLTVNNYESWFNSLDKNRDGNLDQSELQAYLASIKKTKVNQIFDKFDSNQDKALSSAEMKPFFLELIASRPDLKLTEYKYDQWFNAIDKNRNGTLNPSELQVYLKSINFKKANKVALNSTIQGIFSRFDINKDHNLSPEELRPFFNELSAQRPDLQLKQATYNNWFNSIDSDKNGNMDPHELQAYLDSINYKPQAVKPQSVAQRPNKLSINQAVNAIYDRFDINKDKCLSLAELRPFYNELIEQRPDLGLNKYKYEGWFNAIDKDRDGGMDPYELEIYLTKINYKPSLVRKSDVSHVSKNSMQAGAMKAIINGIFDKYDTNKDFTLSIAEFRPFYNDLVDQRPDLNLNKSKYEAWFNLIDKDRDGKMDPSELHAYLVSINYQEKKSSKHSDNVNSIYKRFDINNDMALSPEELRPFFNELIEQRPDLGLNKNKYETWFNAIDQDRNGNMDPKELEAYLRSINYKQGKSKMTDQHVKNVIARFDVNKDDILTVEEVRPFYNELVVERPDLGLSKARCEAWFNTIDQDGDGKIDTAELKSYLAKIKYQG